MIPQNAPLSPATPEPPPRPASPEPPSAPPPTPMPPGTAIGEGVGGTGDAGAAGDEEHVGFELWMSHVSSQFGWRVYEQRVPTHKRVNFLRLGGAEQFGSPPFGIGLYLSLRIFHPKRKLRIDSILGHGTFATPSPPPSPPPASPPPSFPQSDLVGALRAG